MQLLCSVVLWTTSTFFISQVYGYRSNIGGAAPPQTTFPKVVVKDYNVFLVDESGKETQLSTSGTKATPFDELNIWLSENNTYLAVQQITKPGTNRTITLVESSPSDQLQPRYKEIVYDKPGDDLPAYRPKLFNLVEKKEIPIPKDFVDNQWNIEDAAWSFKDDTYRFLYYERGFHLARMIEIDMTGSARILVEETSDYLVQFDKFAWGYMNETDQMWWLSERDGWNHVYLVNTSRAIPYTPDNIKQVTRGEFEVYTVLKVDEKKQVMWVAGFGMVKGHEPYYMHVARVNFDGTGFTVLTADSEGYHRVKFLEGSDNFEDRWSRIDLPLQGALRDADGRKIGEVSLEKALNEGFRKWDNWTTPERFQAPGRDGKTPIYGFIMKPTNFNKDKKYRVIEWIYAAPDFRQIPTEIYENWYLSIFQRLADEQDIVMVTAAGMGTPRRGVEFQKIAYKNIQDAGFPDRIAWIKAAAAERPWMDLNGGVGIWGGSAGGQSAMGALVWHSDFYSGAVADCGCHDNRIDKLWFNEMWMGWPVDDAVYDAGSNVVNAGKTKGQLLLLVSELDSNVDPASTYQVVNALNNAKKDYEFLYVPMTEHAAYIRFENVPLQNKITRFWSNWLATTGK